MENDGSNSGDRPTIMVTNDDGIDAPGLRALVHALVSTGLYALQVCAPDSYVTFIFPSKDPLFFCFSCFCFLAYTN